MYILPFIVLLSLLICAFQVAEGLLTSSFGRCSTPSSFPFAPLQECANSDDDNTIVDPPPEFIPTYTGIDVQLNWELANKPIPIQSELALLNSGVLWRRGEFNRIEGKRVTDVERGCLEVGMTLNQGFLIRKQLAVTKVMRNSWKLKKDFKSMERKFGTQQRTLLQLSKELDLPPVNIVRTILRERVDNAYPEMIFRDRKQMVKSIVYEDNLELVNTFLTAWEIKQLQIAKEFDVIGYSADTTTNGPPEEWEQAIYAYLKERNINYLTEDDMREAGSRITPDCLLLDDCVINGHKVRWIDAKSFYGSGLRESSGIVTKMYKQIAKYEAEFGGSGAIIFKHGFSQNIPRKFPSTLFLDAGPLHME